MLGLGQYATPDAWNPHPQELQLWPLFLPTWKSKTSILTLEDGKRGQNSRKLLARLEKPCRDAQVSGENLFLPLETGASFRWVDREVLCHGQESPSSPRP